MLYLFLGYTAFWLGLLAYAWSIGARQKQLAEDLALLETAAPDTEQRHAG